MKWVGRVVAEKGKLLALNISLQAFCRVENLLVHQQKLMQINILGRIQFIQETAKRPSNGALPSGMKLVPAPFRANHCKGNQNKML
jgi:hypothetical protein